jgi:hypothetical protein
MTESDSPRSLGSGAPRDRIATMLVDPEPTMLVVLANSADPTMLVSGKILWRAFVL